MRCLLIVDHTLLSYDGHSYNYDMAVARSAAQAFDRVDVYADEQFVPQPGDGVIAALPNHSVRSTRVLKRFFARFEREVSLLCGKPRSEPRAIADPWIEPSFLFRAQRYMRAWETAASWESLASSARYAEATELDIFVQHACIAELVATELLARRWDSSGKRLTMHLVIRHSPTWTCSRFESLDALRNRLERLNSLTNPKVHFYTDSRLLSEAFQPIVHDPCQFRVLPIPVNIVASVERRQGERVRLGFLGSPRLEKGFGLIPDIVRDLPPVLEGVPIELAVQTVEDPEESEALRITRWLHSLAPDATRLPLVIWQGPVPTQTYLEWFRSTDILLGLYTSSKYVASTSGVFVEALHCGVPTITFEGTWVADQIRHAAMHGLRIGETIDTMRELPKKVERILCDLDGYKKDTIAFLGLWRQFHSPDRIVTMLYNPGLGTTPGSTDFGPGGFHE